MEKTLKILTTEKNIRKFQAVCVRMQYMNTKKICNNCPRHCSVDRAFTLGFCNEYDNISIAKIIDNFNWEEPCLTGNKGACAIFFSGCNLKCSYCQNFEISCGQKGKSYTTNQFANLLEEKEKFNSYIDLITPTHFSDKIIEALKMYRPKIPIIYNTSGYEDEEVIKKLSSFVDIFLFDLKYADDFVGRKYSKCNDYFTKASKALKMACELKPDKYEKENLVQGVIIRHLVLPDEIENSLKVLDFIKANFPKRKISIMSQFTPNGQGEPQRKLKPIEYKIVISHMEKLELSNGYIQDFVSANDCFIPNFKK